MIAVSWYNPSGQISYWLGSNTTSPTCQNSWFYLFFYLFNHLSAFTSYDQPRAECKIFLGKVNVAQKNWQPILVTTCTSFHAWETRFLFLTLLCVNPFWFLFWSFPDPTTIFISSKQLHSASQSPFQTPEKTNPSFVWLASETTTHEGIQLSGKAVTLFGDPPTTPFCLCFPGDEPARQSAPFARNP